MSRAAWWLDYIEKELDPAMRAQIRHWLKSSAEYKKLVDELQQTRDLIQSQDALGATQVDDDFFLQMESKIMKEVSKTEIKKITQSERMIESLAQKARKNRKVVARTAGFLGFFLLALVSFKTLSGKGLNTQWDIHQQIALQIKIDPQDLGQVIGSESEHDFFVDVASQSLDHLTQEQFETLMKF